MKCVIQRVNEANVKVDNKIVGQINNGYLILVGVGVNDTKEIVEKMVNKITKLRIFCDENDKMNLSIKEVNGSILSISQFTLYADSKKGNRPSFTDSARPDLANELYKLFNSKLREEDILVAEGIFAADMKVSLINDGPVTIILNSDELFNINN